ncbi:hypothetical protein A9G11_03380 [Gilliamella sp. wkB108]|nr:hypothetical protein [Gilliamella apicola]OCG24708.1 hypothetical protein A9G11_03380 [Gilliamella apicola]
MPCLINSRASSRCFRACCSDVSGYLPKDNNVSLFDMSFLYLNRHNLAPDDLTYKKRHPPSKYFLSLPLAFNAFICASVKGVVLIAVFHLWRDLIIKGLYRPPKIYPHYFWL